MIRQNGSDPEKAENDPAKRKRSGKIENDLVKCMEWADGSAAHRKGNTT